MRSLKKLRHRVVREHRNGPSLPPHLEDGRLVTAAALEFGLNLLLLPRQVMIAWRPEGGRDDFGGPPDQGTLSFVHGIPASSTLAGVTYAQDKRTSRDLLRLAKLPTVPGATFSFRGLDDALVYAARIGYPVEVQIAIVDDVAAAPFTVHDEDEFEQTIAALRRVPENGAAAATSLTRAAYSLTGLLDHEVVEDGSEVLAISSRYLIQKVLPGQQVRALVIDDQFAAGVLIGDSGTRDVTKDLHTTFKKRARLAAGAIPVLAAATVDLLVENPSRPAQGQEWRVKDVSERLSLNSFLSAREGLAEGLARRLVTTQASDDRVELAAPNHKQVDLRVRLNGVTGADAFVAATQQHARATGLIFEAQVRDSVEGVVEGRIRGRSSQVAETLEGMMAGTVAASRALGLEAIQSSD